MPKRIINDPLMQALRPDLVKKVKATAPDPLRDLRKFLKAEWSQSVAHIMEASRDYSLYVNDDRAIPFVGDGLKHVQRVALWAMRNRTDKIKVVALGGSLAETGLYVHGDVSCNAAISRLAAPYVNNETLLQGDGHFGSRISPIEGIGAPRYVSVKRAKVAEQILYNDLAIVPLEDNYDGSNKQPIHFLPIIPTVLLNGVSGMGVGYSTNILPHKLEDLIEATIAAIEGKEINRLVPHWKRYDVDVEDLGGNGKYVVWGKLTKLDTSRVQITELPPGIDIAKFRENLIELEDNGDIMRFTDRSTKSINIEVVFKRGAIANKSERQLIDFFGMREKITERLVVQSWNGEGITQIETPEELVRQFVKWRLEWYVNRYQDMLDKASDEIAYWRLILTLIENGFMQMLGTFPDKAAMVKEVETIAKKAKIPTNDRHVDRAISLATYRWTKEFEQEVRSKIKELEEAIADYEDILTKPRRRKTIYASEVKELRKLCK